MMKDSIVRTDVSSLYRQKASFFKTRLNFCLLIVEKVLGLQDDIRGREACKAFVLLVRVCKIDCHKHIVCFKIWWEQGIFTRGLECSGHFCGPFKYVRVPRHTILRFKKLYVLRTSSGLASLCAKVHPNCLASPMSLGVTDWRTNWRRQRYEGQHNDKLTWRRGVVSLGHDRTPSIA